MYRKHMAVPSKNNGAKSPQRVGYRLNGRGWSLGFPHGTCRPSREDATPPPSLKLLGGGGVSERGGKMDLQVHESGK